MGCFFVSAHNFPPQSNVFWNILRHTKNFFLKNTTSGKRFTHHFPLAYISSIAPLHSTKVCKYAKKANRIG